MNVWSNVFLGVIAAATLVTAIFQVGLLVAAGRLARRVGRLVDDVERELLPIFGHLNAIAKDASKAAAVATAQVERVDAVVADLTRRLEESLDAFQASLAAPAREGRAILSGLRAMFDALRQRRDGNRRRSRTDDEDALFI